MLLCAHSLYPEKRVEPGLQLFAQLRSHKALTKTSIEIKVIPASYKRRSALECR